MATSLRRFDRLVPAYRTRHGPDVDAVVFAGGLLVGLIGLVPAFTLAVRYFGLSIPLPSLVATGVVLAAYAATVLVARRIRVGTLAAVVVLGTIAANVPFSGTEYPGALGPSVWLFEVPVIVGFAIAVRDGWHRDLLARIRTRGGLERSLPHVLFGAFVLWSVLAGLFGSGPSLAAGLFFALHVFTAFCVFCLVAGAVARRWVRFRTVLAMLVAATIAHAAFGVSQLVHGRNFGLSYIGEISENSRPIVDVFGVTFHAGPFVSGLTGNPAPLTALVLLAVPVLALHAITARSTRETRLVSGTLAVGLLALVRLTLKDAARGAALLVVLGIVVAAIAITASARRRNDDRSRASVWRTRMRDARRPVAKTLGFALLGVAALAVPVRVVWRRNIGRVSPDASTAGSGSAAAGGGSATSTSASTDTASEAVISTFSKVSGIDLASQSVGFRVTQYLGALDAGLEHPLFGLGGANFAYVVERYGMKAANEPGVDIGNAVHNAYLSVLSGTGVPGLLLFCGLLLGVLLAALELVRESHEEPWLAWGALVGVVGYGVLVFWNVMLVTIVGTVAFFAFAGAIVGARNRSAAKGGSTCHQ